jgi:hypothetical protein
MYVPNALLYSLALFLPFIYLYTFSGATFNLIYKRIYFLDVTSVLVNFSLHHLSNLRKFPIYVHVLGQATVFVMDEPYTWFYQNSWYEGNDFISVLTSFLLTCRYVGTAACLLIVLAIFAIIYALFTRYHVILTPSDYVEKILLRV